MSAWHDYWVAGRARRRVESRASPGCRALAARGHARPRSRRRWPSSRRGAAREARLRARPLRARRRTTSQRRSAASTRSTRCAARSLRGDADGRALRGSSARDGRRSTRADAVARAPLRPARLGADRPRPRDRLARGLQDRPALAASPHLAAPPRLRRRLGHQGAVGALALPAPAAARGRAPRDRRRALPRRARRPARRAGSPRTRSSSAPTGPARWTSRSAPRTGSPRSRSPPSTSQASRGSSGRSGSLLLHGRFIRTHLEWSEARGNHYLSDVVGLLPVAALFSGSAEGRAWAEWAAGELVAEMEHQVRADGATTRPRSRYHRLVTRAVRLRHPGGRRARVPAGCRTGIASGSSACSRSSRDYTRPDGLAPQIGDADDGRFLPLGDYGADPRDHRHLFGRRGRARADGASAAYPDGGYYVLRARATLYAIVRCGDVGPARTRRARPQRPALVRARRRRPGRWSSIPAPTSTPPIRWSGTASARPRSTARFVSTALEQNELRDDDLFLMADRTRAETLASDATSFEGRHHGFPGATHTRRVELHGDELHIRDTVESDDRARARVDVSARAGSRGETRDLGRGPGLSPRARRSYSPRYGVRVPATFLRAQAPVAAGRAT